KKDPVANFENYLLEKAVLSHYLIKDIREKIQKEIEDGLATGFEAGAIVPDTAEEVADVYAPGAVPTTVPSGNKSEKKMIQAISDGLRQSMQKHSNLVLMGQDIAEYGGAFKVTEGFVSEFGKERVRNTPLCESAIVGAALGLSIKGFKSMMEMQFADFVTV